MVWSHEVMKNISLFLLNFMEIYINTKVQLAKMGNISLQLSDYEIENN